MAIKGEEHYIQDSIRVALAQAGYIVFRTNVGKVKTADGVGYSDDLAETQETITDEIQSYNEG